VSPLSTQISARNQKNSRFQVDSLCHLNFSIAAHIVSSSSWSRRGRGLSVLLRPAEAEGFFRFFVLGEHEAEDLEDLVELLVVFAFHGLDLPSQRGVVGQDFAEPDEGPYDGDMALDGAPAPCPPACVSLPRKRGDLAEVPPRKSSRR